VVADKNTTNKDLLMRKKNETGARKTDTANEKSTKESGLRKHGGRGTVSRGYEPQEGEDRGTRATQQKNSENKRASTMT